MLANGWSLRERLTSVRRTKSKSMSDDPGLPIDVPKAGPSDMDLMKEKFAKLLLGEDMSGSGKGVPSALALSNAITNLAASVFGEQRKLEPMTPDRKDRWKKEVGWLLSVADHIVEFAARKQVMDNGVEMEVMGTHQRRDLQANIPALRKIDTMLIEYLDSFKDRDDFWYVKRDACSENDREEQGSEEKWWIPIVKVPTDGLPAASRGFLQHKKEQVNQLLKAAMAINANCLMEMAIPESYIESLPKNGRVSLGDTLYRIITDSDFDPELFLSTVDLTSEHNIVDLKDRIEASVIIWNRKAHNKDSKSSWVSQEKREQFEERAQTLLLIIKHRFPGIPQSTLDIAKIQENRDVGHALLESYSRVLESLAFNVLSRIEDVITADNLAREKAEKEALPQHGHPDDTENNMGSQTLLDFMGWTGEPSPKDETPPPHDDGRLLKIPNIMTNFKKHTYMDKLDFLGGHRSPQARH